MNKPKLIGTREYCQTILDEIINIEKGTLFEMGFYINDLPYFIKNNDTKNNEYEIYDILSDNIKDLRQMLEDMLKIE